MYTRHSLYLLFQLAVSFNHFCTCVSNDRKSLGTHGQKCVIETESRKNGSEWTIKDNGKDKDEGKEKDKDKDQNKDKDKFQDKDKYKYKHKYEDKAKYKHKHKHNALDKHKDKDNNIYKESTLYCIYWDFG